MASTTSRATRLGPRHLLLIGVGLVIMVLLVRAGRITSGMLISLGVLIPSVVLHEIAHGAMAWRLGDRTAKSQGRLSLNPLRHVDPLGSLIVPALSVLAGWGYIGWAKPVPVDPTRLKPGRNTAVAVALAGPLTNMALVGVAWVGFTWSWGHTDFLSIRDQLFFYLGLTNLWLVLINLLPIPPLDGSAILERLLPSSAWPGYLRIRRFLFPALIGVLLVSTMLHLGVLEHLGSWLQDQWISWLN